MTTLIEVFNNREIAIGIWLMIVLVVMLISKSLRQPLLQFLKTALPILFCKKFVVFYCVFISFLLFAVDILKWATFWDRSMLKDTIFWVGFVELPLFVNAVEKAKDNRFFTNLVSDNLRFIVLIEFFVGFWTFDLWIELIAIPATAFVSFLCALATREKKHKPVKVFLDILFIMWGIITFIHAVSCTVQDPKALFNWDTLKSLLLPVLLLVLNLPVVYGLALYSGYEQLFITIKDGAKDKWKMKFQIMRFACISLTRVSAIRRNIQKTILVSLNANDLRKSLNKLEDHLAMQIGDNYMKRAKFYIAVCITASVGSLVGLVLTNSEVSIKDIITLNFILDIPRIKEILTYIFSVSLVFSIALLFYSIGFGKRKNEEITQIKKYAVFEFLFVLKKQKFQLQEYPPIDDPVSLFVNYLQIAYELKEACTKALDVYGNLLNSWERESIELLQNSTRSLLANATIGGGNFTDFNVDSFCEYYREKVNVMQHGVNLNTFTSMLKRDAEKYTQRIEATYEDFKRYYE